MIYKKWMSIGWLNFIGCQSHISTSIPMFQLSQRSSQLSALDGLCFVCVKKEEARAIKLILIDTRKA